MSDDVTDARADTTEPVPADGQQPAASMPLSGGSATNAPSTGEADTTPSGTGPESDGTSTDDSEAPERGRDINWTKASLIAAAMSAVIAAGGLIFTGVATYYDARVSADQLAQSREAGEAEIRQQAARVTMWTEWHKDGLTDGHIVNRSNDPVIGVHVWASFGMADYQFFIPSIPPCSKVTVDEQILPKQLRGKKPISILLTTMTFTDANGTQWARLGDGLLGREGSPAVARYERWWDEADPFPKPIGSDMVLPELDELDSCEGV